MKNHLSDADIDATILQKVYSQTYEGKTSIEGVSLIPLKNFVGEDGDLTEVIKFTEKGEVEQIPGFTLRQVNRTTIHPHTIKGWHLHMRQNDVWHVTPASHLIVGLWDVRKNVKTKGKVMRLALGGGKCSLTLYPQRCCPWRSKCVK